MIRSGRQLFAASLMTLASAILLPATGAAQFGIGAGVAAMGDNILESGVNLSHVSDGDSVQYGDIGGVIGGYVIGHFRYGYGSFTRLNVDVSYVFVPSKNIRLVEASSTSNEAVFEVGATLIPIAIGTEIVMPNKVVRPYLGAQVTYTIFNRTFAYVQGNEAFNRDDIHNEWEGHNRWGLAFRTGCEFALGNIALDIGARYNLASLFNETDGSESMNYLQIGANLLFGELIYTQEQDKAEGR